MSNTSPAKVTTTDFPITFSKTARYSPSSHTLPPSHPPTLTPNLKHSLPARQYRTATQSNTRPINNKPSRHPSRIIHACKLQKARRRPPSILLVRDRLQIPKATYQRPVRSHLSLLPCEYALRPTSAGLPRLLRAQVCEYGAMDMHEGERAGHSKVLAGCV